MKIGILWTSAEKILVYGITFFQSIILARLLCPKDFGLCAMTGIFLGVGGMISDSGLSTVLVVKEGLSRRSERCAFFWNVSVAVGLCGFMIIFAPFISKWFTEPALQPLLRVLSFSIVINSAGIVAVARLNRMQQFARLSWMNGFACIASSMIGIALAYVGYGVWSIVYMMLAMSIMRTALSWFWSVGLPTGKLNEGTDGSETSSLRALLTDGWKLTVSGMISTAYYNFFHVIIGKLWSPASVGLFIRGQRWAQIPGEVMNEAISRVALPNLAGRISNAYGFSCLNMLLLWPGLVILWLFADELINRILGGQWGGCVLYLRILIIGQFFTPISNVAQCALKATGRTDLILLSDTVKKPLALCALGMGCFFGIEGMCWAKVVSDITDCIIDVLYVIKSGILLKTSISGKRPMSFMSWFGYKQVMDK